MGALLPFTGELGTFGHTIERGVIMAAEAVNEGGGVLGRPLRVVSLDSRSEVDAGLVAAERLLEDEEVVAIIGPENSDLGTALLPMLRENGVPLISASEASVRSEESRGVVFHTSPTAAALGRALAGRMYSDGQLRAGVIAERGAYGDSFSAGWRAEFERLGGEVVAVERYDRGQQSYRDALDRLSTNEPQAVVLVAYPSAGAAIVMEAALLGHSHRWYLSPTLNSESFVFNVSPGLLEGVVGVSAEVGGEAGAFAAAFERRWDGEEPSQAAYFYFDALILWALAYEGAKGGGVDEVSAMVLESSRGPGEVFAWNQVTEALARVRAGEPVDYCGASGSLDLDNEGELVDFFIGFYEIVDDRIRRRTPRGREFCRFAQAD